MRRLPDLADDRRLMGPLSGGLWLCAAACGAVGQALPGAPHARPLLIWLLIAGMAGYGMACVQRWIPWERATVGHHAIAVFAFQPLIVVGLWASGGADSYIAPILVLAMFYVAYFFPPRLAWPLAAVETLTYASPLLYSGVAAHALAPRVAAFAISFAALIASLQALKRRLVAAERVQHDMAHRDPLTGLANRRAFDAALAGALATAGRPGEGRRAGDGRDRFALLLVDVDDFKAINDGWGHTTGDRVLRELAARASAGVRPGDCLARIGGDELAVVAPGAGEDGARRLAAALRDAAAQVRPGRDASPVSLTVSWALFPDDGADADGLLRSADRSLHDGKRSRRPQALAHGG